MQNLKDQLIKWQGPKILMTIFPHPDDETMATGGLLMEAKRLGWQTIVVSLTHGEAGQNFLGRGDLKTIREQELKKAIKILGVDKLILGNFPDGNLRATQKTWFPWIKHLVKEHSPGWIVTYDHSGLTGHPDHISLSRAISSLKTGAKLWWSTMPLNVPAYNKAVADFITIPTHQLVMPVGWIKKAKAARMHASQGLGKDLPIPLWVALAWLHREWYHEVDRAKVCPYKFVYFKI